ncbi:hypothetical protein HBI56_216270 [Parastagonospora nodorum]|nr:hypothetical protein HBH52_203610 [Parastagonospora nodorum]KAH3971214.1 hypothetical protein HBH51_109340 [Parastagonospora nodorum]KAH4007318.1 hypothetical protein HBI10_010370 [Parastagonospora nodorum]KAH4008394.1 hypothetical protein HBI13_237370 [Parastagonospora nodorum]KAH4041405.1 hypothetical protein HBI09_022200 [Parastagonospora nodorum]
MAAMDQIPPEQLAKLAGEDLGPLTKNIVIAFTVIALVSVSLRIYTRFRYKAVGWEDYSITIATLLSLATGIVQVLQANAGNGKHAMFVRYPDKVELVLKYLFWSIITYNLSLMFIKISIIMQYKRIFTLGGMQWPLNIAMGICVAWGVSTFGTSIFGCVPVKAFWDLEAKANANCVKDEILWFLNAGMNIFTDLMVASLPVKAIWALQLPNRQKFALIGVLTIGWFVCLVSFLRLHALVVLSQHMDDRTYYSAATAYWSSIEMNLGIVCASLPALKPLIVRIIPAFSTRHSSKGYGAGYSGRLSEGYGLRSRATRHTNEGDAELPMGPMGGGPYSPRADQDGHGKSIYVTQQVEHHYEKNNRSGSGSDIDIDSESQKDLVTSVTYSSPLSK